MDETQVNVNDKFGRYLGGVISLVTGLMYFIPGLFFVDNVFTDPDWIVIFAVVFMLSIGLILISFSYKMFTGNLSKQHISTPLLAFISIIFILMSLCFALSVYVFNFLPGHMAGKAIGGCLAIGGLGLHFAYKRTRENNN